jgi:gliding motility-associated-like protein
MHRVKQPCYMKICLAIILAGFFFNQSQAAGQFNGNPVSSNTDTIVCINIMKAFTPNKDGTGDYWQIGDLSCIANAQVKVFSRWGNLVFESKDYKNNWDGTEKNKPLPGGTYYYILTVALINNTTQELKGDVTILR